MDRLERFNRSRGAAALVLAGIFLLLFVCTHETDLIADDYRYCFSYADDSRIVSAAQIFPSMAAHRHIMNGRVVPHFLVQLFLMLPKGIFDFVNAAFFTALVWLIGFTAGRAPSFTPPPRMVNQPPIEMTDMENAQRMAYNAALQDALSQLR